jgi:beta-lactamase regulating signal transducer with metallopeptidase domain
MTLWTTLCDAPWVERLGWTLIHSVWQLGLVGLAYGLILTLFSHRSANLRYLAGCAALVLMVGMSATTFLSLGDGPAGAQVVEQEPRGGEAPDVEATRPSAPSIKPRATSAPATFTATAPSEPTDGSPPPVTPPDAEAGVGVGAVDRFARLRAVMPWLVAGWLLGVVVLSVRPLWGLWTVRRLRRWGRSALPERLERTARALAERFRLNAAVEFAQSTLVEVPAVVGFFRPMVLLPVAAIAGLSARELEMILAHELAHVRRRDYLVNLLQTVIETLFFYHPAAWWISRQVRNERENCCDDAALAVCGDRATYARALAGLAEQRVWAASGAPALAGGSLVARIRRVTGHSPGDGGMRRPGAWLAGALLLLCVVVPIGLEACHRGAVLANGPPGLQRLIEQLSSNDPAEVDAAVDELAARGPSVAEDMIPLLASGRTDTGATRVLQRLAGDRQVQEILLEALDSTSPNTRHCALVALGASGNEDHVDRIAEMLDRPPHPIAAIVALGQIGGDRAVARLIESLETVDRKYVFLAVRALGDLRALEAVEPLEAMLRKIREDSIEAYPRATVPAIIQALQDIQEVQGTEVPRTAHQFCQGVRFQYPFQGPGLMKTFSVSECRDAYIQLPEVDPATESGRTAVYQALLDASRPNSLTMDGTRLLAFDGLELAPLPPKDPRIDEYSGYVVTLARLRQARRWAETHEPEGGPVDGIRVYPLEEKTSRFFARTTDGQLALVTIERTSDDFQYNVTFRYIDPHYGLLLPADPTEPPAVDAGRPLPDGPPDGPQTRPSQRPKDLLRQLAAAPSLGMLRRLLGAAEFDAATPLKLRPDRNVLTWAAFARRVLLRVS